MSILISLHQRSLGSSPRRRGELENLKTTEEGRAEAFSKMVQSFANDTVKGIEEQGPTLRRRLTHLVSVNGNMTI